MTDDRLPFKEMCAKFDVTPRTLRYYEYIELLAPDREGRSRFYGARDQARMVLILRGRRWGFSLEEIRQWLDLYEQRGSTVQMQTLVNAAGGKLQELEQQKAHLEETITELRDLRNKVAQDLESEPDKD